MHKGDGTEIQTLPCIFGEGQKDTWSFMKRLQKEIKRKEWF